MDIVGSGERIKTLVLNGDGQSMMISTSEGIFSKTNLPSDPLDLVMFSAKVVDVINQSGFSVKKVDVGANIMIFENKDFHNWDSFISLIQDLGFVRVR